MNDSIHILKRWPWSPLLGMAFALVLPCGCVTIAGGAEAPSSASPEVLKTPSTNGHANAVDEATASVRRDQTEESPAARPADEGSRVHGTPRAEWATDPTEEEETWLTSLRLAQAALNRRAPEEARVFLRVALEIAPLHRSAKMALAALDENYLTAGRRLDKALREVECTLASAPPTDARQRLAEATEETRDDTAHEPRLPAKFEEAEVLLKHYMTLGWGASRETSRDDLHGQGSILCRCPVCVPPQANPETEVLNELREKFWLGRHLELLYGEVDTHGSAYLKTAVGCRLGDLLYDIAMTVESIRNRRETLLPDPDDRASRWLRGYPTLRTSAAAKQRAARQYETVINEALAGGLTPRSNQWTRRATRRLRELEPRARRHLGCPCERREQCATSHCLPITGTSVCTQLCTTDCPEGFTCRSMSGSGGQGLCVRIGLPGPPQRR